MWAQVAKSNIKARIPFKSMLRAAVRAVAPYRTVASNDRIAFRQGTEIVGHALKHGAKLDRVLEIGTGWMPTIPYLFHAAGAGEIVMTDVERLIDAETAEAARTFVGARLNDVAVGLPIHHLYENMSRPLNSLYLCPFDWAKVEPGSVDVVYSRTVLEHIRLDDLRQILADGRKYLRPGGLAVHVIDNSDHYEHRDKSLSRLNFLRYPDIAWEAMHWKTGSYQNRLRHSNYIRLFEAAGYDIIDAVAEVDQKTLANMPPLAPRFAVYGREDLATLTTTIIARNPG